MLVREQLEKQVFSEAEQVVVNFILNNSDRIENMSIQEIALQTYTQPSTLIRISKKLNYSGWKDLKSAYLEEWEYLSKNFSKIDANLPFQKNDNIMTISKKLASLEKSTIDDIVSLLNHDSLSEAKNLLSEANNVIIFAQNANILIAQDFALKMKRIKKNTYISSISGEEAYEAYNMSKDSCVIIISYSGENPSLLKVNSILKSRGIPTIAITSIGDNSLSEQSICFLPITTREKLYSKIGNFTINNSISFLLDVLYSIVFSIHYDDNLLHLKQIGEKVDKREISTEIMKEEDNLCFKVVIP